MSYEEAEQLKHLIWFILILGGIPTLVALFGGGGSYE